MGHPKDPAHWLLKRNRDGDKHITNCGSKGYTGLSTYSNIHHIVCISCMADGTIDGYVTDAARRKFIENCLAETNWDINAKDNVVGLPKKQAYVDKLAPLNWGTWPCHQVDHPSYLEKVSDRINDDIWVTCQDVAQDCKVKGQAIATQLGLESTFWFGKLSGRGTAAAWATRKQNPDKWYIPFSMDIDDPSPRKPPPDWTDNFTSGMISKLSELFEML
jgi:hypothetical protein